MVFLSWESLQLFCATKTKHVTFFLPKWIQSTPNCQTLPNLYVTNLTSGLLQTITSYKSPIKMGMQQDSDALIKPPPTPLHYDSVRWWVLFCLQIYSWTKLETSIFVILSMSMPQISLLMYTLQRLYIYFGTSRTPILGFSKLNSKIFWQSYCTWILYTPKNYGLFGLRGEGV